MTVKMVCGVILLWFLTIGIYFTVFAVPAFLSARKESHCNNCQENLQMLELSTRQWVLDNDTFFEAPKWDDLLRENDYLHPKPVCTAGGHYILDTIEEVIKPALSANPDFLYRLDGY